jgi:FKBP-type peptidyl-prolyl cis-trans isomerase FkpA
LDIKMLRYVCIAVLFMSFLACGKKKAAKQAKKDEATIQQYIGDHSLNATATGSGLYYVITSQGTGVNPTQSSMVTVSYTGTLTDGSVFDASLQGGASFQLSGVIKGWQEGIPYFKKGGKGKLLIPSALGYGTQGTGNIPPNAVLIFDINLIDVK